MRKLVIYIGIFILFIIPLNVNAVSIVSTNVTGVASACLGEEVSVNFDIKFSDLVPSDDNTLGIYYVLFGFEYDDSVFSITGLSDGPFKSELYTSKEKNKLYVYSIIKDNYKSNLICPSTGLYCGDYSVTVKFYIKDVTKKNTTIKMKDIEIGLLDIKEDRIYTNDDLILINKDSNIIHNFKLTDYKIMERSNSIGVLIPKSNVSSNKVKKSSKQSIKVSNTNRKTSNKKSTNNYLKSLEISNHEIDFNKYRNEYEVNISNKVNSLDIKLSLEDKKAKYKVIGADDLKNNNYKVNIEVTSEDGKKNIYTIKAKVKEVEEVITEEVKHKEKVDKRFIIYGGIGLGVIFLVVIVIFIINKIKDRKINKLLDEM